MTEEVTESQFGVNSIKTLDSVQKSSEIRNFCTDLQSTFTLAFYSR